MSIFSRPRSFKFRPRGFTLTELLIVVALIVVITAVLLVRQQQFNSSTLLRSLAYSVALSVRQSQVYGTTVFGVSIAQGSCTAGTYSAGSCFAPGYGVYFSSGDAALEPPQYRLFGDLNGNGRYDSGEEIQTFTLATGYRISSFCGGRTVGNVQDCWPTPGAGGSALTSLSIIFKRPNADGCFSTDTQPNACGSGSMVYASSTVKLISGGGDTRTIGITSTGQITVCPANRAC